MQRRGSGRAGPELRLGGQNLYPQANLMPGYAAHQGRASMGASQAPNGAQQGHIRNFQVPLPPEDSNLIYFNEHGAFVRVGSFPYIPEQQQPPSQPDFFFGDGEEYLQPEPGTLGPVSEKQGRQFFRLPGFFQGTNNAAAATAQNMAREEPRTKPAPKPKEPKLPDFKSKQCADPSCCKEFTFFQKRHRCYICSLDFCNNCSLKTTIQDINFQLSKTDGSPQNSKKSPSNIWICHRCHNQIKIFNNFKGNHLEQVKVDHYKKMNSQSAHPGDKFERSSQGNHSQFSENEARMSSMNFGKDQEKVSGGVGPLGRWPGEEVSSPERLQEVLEVDGRFLMKSYLEQQQPGQNEEDVKDVRTMTESQQRWRRLKLLSKYHICQTVRDLVEQAQIQWKWEPYLQKFVVKAVDSVKPSCRYLKDSMDFNEYVDIQIIDYKDESMSQYVNGSVLLKNLAEKSMPKLIRNPKILLLWGALGVMKNFEDLPGASKQSQQRHLYMDINSVISQEDQYVEILKQKLENIKPDVVITEKEISFKVLEVLKEQGVAAISNVSEAQLLNLARLTQTIIAPSANVIDQSFQMGHCKLFRVEDPHKYSVAKARGLSANEDGHAATGRFYRAKSIYRGKNMSLTRQDQGQSQYFKSLAEIDLNKQIIFFEGCNQVLGCTILLSGPINRNQGLRDLSSSPGAEFVNLLKIKANIRKMLHISRNIILERDFLDHLKIDPQIDIASLDAALQDQKAGFGVAHNNMTEVVKKSPFLVTRLIKNRSTLVLYKTMIKKGQQSQRNEPSLLTKINQETTEENMQFSPERPHEGAGAKQLRTRSQNNLMSQAARADASVPSSSRGNSGDNLRTQILTELAGEQLTIEKTNKVDEHFVKTKSDAMCGHPRKIKFQFYNINLLNYDSQLYHQAQEHLDQIVNDESKHKSRPQSQSLEELREIDQKNVLDYHRYERDETLGNFLVRIAQQAKKNLDDVANEKQSKFQRYMKEDRTHGQSQSTHFFGKSNSEILDKEQYNRAFGGYALPNEQHKQSLNGKSSERRYHILQCTHKGCRAHLSRHMLLFYHKDGHLEIQVQPALKQSKSKNTMAQHYQREWSENLLDLKDASRMQTGADGSLAPPKGSVFSGTSASASLALMQTGNPDVQQAHQQTTSIKKNVKNWDAIFFSHNCMKCDHNSGAKQLLSDALFEYSISRFIEQYFYNSKLQDANRRHCPHCPLRDSLLFFHMADGSTISFKFSRAEVYTIELLNIKQQQNNLALLIEMCAQKKSEIGHLVRVKDAFFRGQMAATMELVQDFEERNPEMEACAQQRASKAAEGAEDTESNKDEVVSQCSQWLEVIKKQLQKLQQSFALFVSSVGDQLKLLMKELEARKNIDYFQKHYTPMDMQKLNFIERKFIMNHLSYDAVVKQYQKSLCIVLTLAEQRLTVLGTEDGPAPQDTSDTTRGYEMTGAKEKSAIARALFPHLQDKQAKHRFLRVKKTSSMQSDLDKAAGENLVEQQDADEEQEYLPNKQNNYVGGTASNVAANFFLMKGRPPMLSVPQAFKFMKTFFGSPAIDPTEAQSFEDLEVQLRRALYHQGYRQILHSMKGKLNKLQGLVGVKIHQFLDEAGVKACATEEEAREEDLRQQSTSTSLLIPLGSDSCLLNVAPENNGSIIAYALSSNIYKEALIKNNYLDFQQRAKNLIQQNNELKQQTGQRGMQSHSGLKNLQRQVLNLVHKDDIFNFEYPHQLLETELLCGEQQRLSFSLSFSNYIEESSVQIQKHSSSNCLEIRSGDNSMAINTYKKIKTPHSKSKKSKAQRNDMKGFNDGQLSSKYMDLNLQTQILKDFPITLLEVPTQPNQNAAAKGRHKLDELKEGLESIAYDSILVLQNKVYNQINQMFFDGFAEQTSGVSYDIVKLSDKLDAKKNHGAESKAVNLQHHQSQAPRTAPETSKKQAQKQPIVVSGGFGGAVASYVPPKKETSAERTVQAGGSNGPAAQGSKLMKQTLHGGPSGGQGVSKGRDAGNQYYHQQNLFGMRKPITIFYDTDYKQRILMEEMTAAQSIIYPQVAEERPLKEKDQTHSVSHSAEKDRALDRAWQLSLGAPPKTFTKVDYNVKMYYPKKFEVLRKFYCGSHLNFIQSMMSSDSWRDVTGGRTMSPFQKTFDQKYVMKEVKRQELKMFLEFAPQYFDYLCKSFFHDYPCTLAKIVGVYKIKINQYVERVDMRRSYQFCHLQTPREAPVEVADDLDQPFGSFNPTGIVDPDDEAEYLQSCQQNTNELQNNLRVLRTIKKYVFVIENLNFGLTEEGEKHIIRYDLKGSTLNRFVQDKDKEMEQRQKSRRFQTQKDGKLDKNQSQSNADLHNPSDRIQSSATHALKRPDSPKQSQDRDFEVFAASERAVLPSGTQGRYRVSRVYQDNNFILDMGAKPLPMRYNMNKILNICVNNDTLCLSKSQIIDYSLLLIINTKTKKLRFGIIDYVQHYTLERMLEMKFKKLIKGSEPTIVDPESYKKRFVEAVKKYFIAMCIQNEKVEAPIARKLHLAQIEEDEKDQIKS